MKRIVAIGGGELRERTTLKIDEYIAGLAKEHAGENRPNALFIPTASHDYMPYYNTFHKVYTMYTVMNLQIKMKKSKIKDIIRLMILEEHQQNNNHQGTNPVA